MKIGTMSVSVPGGCGVDSLLGSLSFDGGVLLSVHEGCLAVEQDNALLALVAPPWRVRAE